MSKEKQFISSGSFSTFKLFRLSFSFRPSGYFKHSSMGSLITTPNHPYSRVYDVRSLQSHSVYRNSIFYFTIARFHSEKIQTLRLVLCASVSSSWTLGYPPGLIMERRSRGIERRSECGGMKALSRKETLASRERRSGEARLYRNRFSGHIIIVLVSSCEKGKRLVCLIQSGLFVLWFYTGFPDLFLNVLVISRIVHLDFIVVWKRDLKVGFIFWKLCWFSSDYVQSYASIVILITYFSGFYQLIISHLRMVDTCTTRVELVGLMRFNRKM